MVESAWDGADVAIGPFPGRSPNPPCVFPVYAEFGIAGNMPSPGLCRVDGRGRGNPLVGGGGRGWVLGIFRWLRRRRAGRRAGGSARAVLTVERFGRVLFP